MATKVSEPDDGKIKCPGCDLRLDAKDLDGQMIHMDKNHPDIIEKRRREAPTW